MKACVYHEPGLLKVEGRSRPSPGPGEILIQTRAASLCFSDIRVFRGEKHANPGIILGHEVAGTVVAIGNGVTGFGQDDRVAICPIISCGTCYFCIRGKRNRCTGRKTLGYQADGGLAEYVLLPKELVSLGHVMKIPAGLAWDIACQMEPFACALYSMETCRVGPGTSLTIIGMGPMGLTHLLIAKAMGCSTIVVSDPLDDRLAVAEEFGATAIVNPQRVSVKEAVSKFTDGMGTDASVITTGNIPAIEAGIEVVRKQGIVNIFAGLPPQSTLAIDPNQIHYDELFLTGTQNANPEHYSRALWLLNDIPKAKRLITQRYPIEEAPKAFEARGKMDGLKTVIDF